MAKTIRLQLSERSFANAVKEIEAYKNSLQTKCETFLSKLAQIGIEVVRATMDSVPEEDRGSYSIEEINRPPNGVSIVLGGNKVLFVEFGAGVIYSNPQNPKAGELGYGVGTYPNQRYAFNLTQWGGGWWYKADNGEHEHSYGNPAYMPMYKAEVEVLGRVLDIAKEVFGG